MTQSEINSLFGEKVRRGIFKPVARHLTDETTAEDRLQIAICMTWEMFSRYAAERNVVLSDGILVHSCRQRAVDLNRDFVPADGHCRNRDVHDPRAYRDGRVELLHLDGVDRSAGEPDRAVEIAYAESNAQRTERKLNSAIDLEAWVNRQASMDRLMLEKRMEGYSEAQVAFDLDQTPHRVRTRTRALGHELAGRIGVHIENSREDRKAASATN